MNLMIFKVMDALEDIFEIYQIFIRTLLELYQKFIRYLLENLEVLEIEIKSFFKG